MRSRCYWDYTWLAIQGPGSPAAHQPLCCSARGRASRQVGSAPPGAPRPSKAKIDRKSTRLNSSHTVISYAVFCLKKKKKTKKDENNKKRKQRREQIDRRQHRSTCTK